MSNEVDILINNNKVSIRQETNYPWSGDIKLSLKVEKSSDFIMAFRIPDWCYSYSVKVNDEKAEYKIINGYISILRDWNTSDTIEINFEMEIQEIVANPNIKDDLGKVAIQRGPFIYCLEEVDNGENLHLIKLLKSSRYEYEFDSKLLGGVGKIKTKAKKLIIDNSWEGQLYRSDRKSPIYEECEITFVPYYSWANRSVGEMRVFINKDL